MVKTLQTDQQARTQVVRSSHEMFARVYFGHYFTHPFAPFHSLMFAYTEDPNLKSLAALAFRSSGKSTIFTLSFPIWSIIGDHQKKCILIIGQTQAQARQYLDNIKDELTNNPLLVSDLGPFEERDEQWNSGAIVIKQYGAKIIALSREQSIRGLRYLQNRPDLIICDDVEDIESTKALESREANFEWYTSEVIPCGYEKTQFVYVGNLVHEDCIIERLRKSIESGRMNGVFIRVPIVENDQPTWPERFPDMATIEDMRLTVQNDKSWHREYMLKIVDTDERLLCRDQIQFYDALPKDKTARLVVLGTDLAVSQKPTADFSAFVPALLFGTGKERKIYILPDITNSRLMLHDSKRTIIAKAEMLERTHRPPEILIEDTPFQVFMHDDLRQDGYRARMVPLKGMSKRERLEQPASWVAQGKVLFPRVGADKLVDQLVNFGLTAHDDMCDAFSLAVNYLIDKTKSGKVGMGVATWSHAEIIYFDEEQIEAEIEQDDKNLDDRDRFKEAVETEPEFAKHGLRWNGYGDWQVIPPPPTRALTCAEAQKLRMEQTIASKRRQAERRARLAAEKDGEPKS